MNLTAPRARMVIVPKGPHRWRSNGHLRRCRCACFAKRAVRDFDSAGNRRKALSGAHVRPSTLCSGSRGALRPT
jgi:hypothetical protein